MMIDFWNNDSHCQDSFLSWKGIAVLIHGHWHEKWFHME
jgi:hypothetical protein